MRAFVFPGQGTQFVGMGVELAQRHPLAAELFDLADEVLGLPLRRIMAEGPAERLMETEITQPAVLAYSLALLRLLRAAGQTPDAVAGYSLGEYAALVAAGCLEEAEALHLVQQRARFMTAAYPLRPNAMAIALGPPAEEIEALLATQPAGLTLCVAGYCCPGLVSLAGDAAGLAWLEEAGAGGGAQVRPVPVTLPFHSPLLKGAQEPLRRRLEQTQLQAPRCPLVVNVTGRPEQDPERLRASLVEQVVRPVRWTETVASLRALGVSEVWEVGPGASLSSYLRRIDRKLPRISVCDSDTLAAALAR